MKKILKSIGICIGIFLLNMIIGGIISVICSSIVVDSNELNKYIYPITFIADLITLVLIHLILLKHNIRLLSKDTFKKITSKELINICLFAIGISVILSIITGILNVIFPSYSGVQNQLMVTNTSLLQSIVVIVLIPIYEEILFRYVIFEHFKKNYNLVFAIIAQALFFGLFHLNIVQGIYTFILGIALALIYMYSESLVGSIVLHMVFNLLGTLIIPKLSLMGTPFQLGITIIGLVCLFISALRMLKKYEYELYNN